MATTTSTTGAGSSRAPAANAWYTDVPGLPEGETAPTLSYNRIPVISDLKPYSLRNGTPDEIEPYLLTSAIPEAYHWIPINGLAPGDAMKCVDGFIRSYMYKLGGADAAALTANRKEALILGTCRAVMTANYELTVSDLNSQEVAAPVLSVVFAENGTPTYTALVPPTNSGLLTANLVLTDEEVDVVKVLARCGQAIVPVQGLNLISDGHHYLSDKAKQSFKSFLAVERQVWMPKAFKDWIAGVEEKVRDVMWHKAGHPVAVALKENAATDPQVKVNLEAAKMGSAAARLPALESDLRAADTYLKLAEAVDAIWATAGGGVSCELLRYRVGIVKSLPRSSERFSRAIDIGDNVEVDTRAAAMEALKATVVKHTDKAAVLYGFYCSMLDMGAGEVMGTSTDTLRSAYSLKKLRTNNIASFLIGTELYRDYRAMRQAARRAADRTMPKYSFDPQSD